MLYQQSTGSIGIVKVHAAIMIFRGHDTEKISVTIKKPIYSSKVGPATGLFRSIEHFVPLSIVGDRAPA